MASSQVTLSPRTSRWLLLLVASLALAGCQVEQDEPLDELFPLRVGLYARAEGPSRDPSTGADQARYDGPDGAVWLHVKRVGKEQVSHALSQLPPAATDIRGDPALGQRQGTFFAFGGQFHAAWGNRDWVFVINAPTEAARVAFLAGYGY